MSTIKQKRIAAAIQRALGLEFLILGESWTKISITRVSVSPDIKYAKIFYTLLPTMTTESAQTMLDQHNKSLRQNLAQKLNLRVTPVLTFCHDESIEQAWHLNQIIDAAVNQHVP